MSEREKHIDQFDIALILARRRVIIQLIETGRWGEAEGMDLWDKQTDYTIIEEERAAHKSIQNGGPDDDSPLYRLSTQLVKLPPSNKSES